MQRIGIFYATREGQTRRIAEHIAQDLSQLRFLPELVNVADYPAGEGLHEFDGLILAASNHRGEHEPEMVHFVKRNLNDLETIPSAFLSVSLSAAGAERAESTEDERVAFCADIQEMLDKFFKETGWKPQFVRPVAGALMYTKYSFLVRLVMRQIAKKVRADTDTSRDYEYTDWASLDHFVEAFAKHVSQHPKEPVPAGAFQSPVPATVVSANRPRGSTDLRW